MRAQRELRTARPRAGGRTHAPFISRPTVIRPSATERTDPRTPLDSLSNVARRSRIASYKKPRSIEFVDALPVIEGRVDYDALDDKFGGGGYPGGANIGGVGAG